MNDRGIPDTLRDRMFAAGTRVLGVLLLPAAYLRAPGRARYLACQWALAARYPSEELDGLRPSTRAAFTWARAEAFWRDHQLIGLTSGHRDAGVQQRMFEAAVRRDLYRRYDNEWWHFEHCPGTHGRRPEMLPHPGAVAVSVDTGPVPFLTSMSGTLL